MPAKRRFPTALTVIMIVIVLAAIGTWIIPAGRYDRLSFQSDHFELETISGKRVLPANQAVLDSLGIKSKLEKFQSGDIRKPVAVPGTYRQTESKPQGIVKILEAPIKGIYDTIDIILFVLVIGGFIAVFYESGALEKGIRYLVHALRGRESSLIIVFTILFAAAGSSYGMAEEGLAFFPVLVPVFLAAGYDLLLPVAIIFLAPQIGTMASLSNPFAVIIASDVAGVKWTSGLSGRLVLFGLSTGATLWYLLRYGRAIRKDPSRSMVYRYEGEHPSPAIPVQSATEPGKMDRRTIMVLALFVLTFAVMIAGVVYAGWWLLEMSAIFLASSILLAFLLRMNEKIFVEKLVKGAEGLLGVAFIVGLARGVTVVLNEGEISDTILFYASEIVKGLPTGLFIVTVWLVYMVLTLFISSTSGMAVLTMPIMGALAGMNGVSGERVVDAYLLGMGVMGTITPTGLALPSLAMVNLSYKTWLRFMFPLMGLLMIISILYLVISVSL